MAGQLVLAPPRPIRRPTFRSVTFLAATLLVTHLGLLLLRSDDQAIVTLQRAFLPLESLLAAGGLFYAGQRARVHSPRLGVAWGILALAQTGAALGDLMWLAAATGIYRTNVPTLPDGLYVLFYPLFLIGIWRIFRSCCTPRAHLTRFLDLSVLMVGILMVGWSFLIGPLFAAGVTYDLPVLALTIAYPACDLLLLLGLVGLLLTRVDGQRSAPLLLLAGATAVLMLTHACFVYQLLLAGSVSGGLFDLGGGLASLVICLAGILQGYLPPAGAQPAERREPTWPLYVPYASLAVTVLLLAWNYGHPVGSSFFGVVGGVAVIIALMSARQVTAVMEHNRLYAQLSRSQEDLELRVDKRTADMARINQDLHDEMQNNAHLYVSLQKTNQQLLSAIQAKDEMIQNVSHELRTPLMLIMGYVELLNERDLGELAPQQSEAVDIILRQGERLRFMVNRLLTLQTFDATKMRPELMDLGSWITRSVDAWQVRAAQAGIHLSAHVDAGLPQVVADRDYLGQVLENLLDNAVKFTPQDGEIEVHAWVEGRELMFCVADSGIGIPPEKREQVFDRFYQVDGRSTRRFGGMGIGLALCRTIAEAHRGRIWVEGCAETQGSVFKVALPLAN